MQGQSSRIPLVWALLGVAACGCSPSYSPLAQPPIGAASVGPGGSSNSPASGMYRGEAVALNDPGGYCSTRMAVTNWTVSGNEVSFGAFRGTIQPDGALAMQAGPRYVQGRYTGSHFVGRYTTPQPSCEYQITVDPVG